MESSTHQRSNWKNATLRQQAARQCAKRHVPTGDLTPEYPIAKVLEDMAQMRAVIKDLMSDEEGASAEEVEIATAMAAAKTELDTRLEAVMRERETTEDAVYEGEDTEGKAEAAERKLGISTGYLKQATEARAAHRGKLEILEAQRITLATEEELQREAKKKEKIEEAINAAVHTAARSTEETDEDLHCDALTRH
jgi:hypothetical protein